MPRGPRLDAPGIFHHVMARGVERRAIFLLDADREDFLARLEMAVENDAAFIYAWCLMPDYFLQIQFFHDRRSKKGQRAINLSAKGLDEQDAWGAGDARIFGETDH